MARDENKNFERIAFHVSPETYEILKRMAKAEDRTLKKTVERLVRLTVKKENGEN